MTFAKDYVLYCNITTRIPGHPHDDLLSEKGGMGFPYIVFMDSEGNVVVKHESDRSAAGFSATGTRVKEYVALRDRAAEGDPAARVEFFIVRLELDHFTFEQAQKEREGLELSEEQQKRFTETLNDLEVKSIMDKLGGAQKVFQNKEKIAEAVRQFQEMDKAGRTPSGEQPFLMFWIAMVEHAKSTEDPALFEHALEAVKVRFGSDPRFARGLKELEQELEKLRPVKKEDKE